MKAFALLALTFVAGISLESDPIASTPTPPDVPATYKPYKASDSGMPGYDRVIPERFSTDADDQFMRSVIGKYAVETRDKDGKPTGQYYLDKAGAKSLADEVVGTHTGRKGADKTDYIGKVFDSAWDRADVNGEGKIEVARSAPLMRNIIGNQQADLHLAIKK